MTKKPKKNAKLKTKPRQTKKEIIRGHVCRDKNAAWCKKQTEYPVAAMNYYERLPNTTTRTFELTTRGQKNKLPGQLPIHEKKKKYVHFCIDYRVAIKNGPPTLTN